MEDNKELLTRIAVCAMAAYMIYYSGNRLSEQFHIEALEKYRPWLDENKIQAIAVMTAVIFGASLSLFPLPVQENKEQEEPEFF